MTTRSPPWTGLFFGWPADGMVIALQASLIADRVLYTDDGGVSWRQLRF